MAPKTDKDTIDYSLDPNTVGGAFHIPRYPPSLLSHVEAEKLKPRSPYFAVNQGDNDDFFTRTDPMRPPDTGIPLKYSDLPKGKWIRILKLEPGTLFNILVCSLLPIDLSDVQHEKYEALSYTWGAYYDSPAAQNQSYSQFTRIPNPIVCNGVLKSVSNSLRHALFYFRRIDRPRYLWADALCINQDDNAEKELQVALMQHIYKAAKEVLIWVGWRCDAEVEAAMNLICYLANQECNIEKKYGQKAIWYAGNAAVDTPRISGRPASADSWYEDDHPADTATVPFVPTSLAPLVPLFESRYFRRLWVFQEVALSPLAAMFWGTARVRFEWVAVVAELISREYVAEFAGFDDALAGLRMCARMYGAWRGNYARSSFFELVVETGELKASQAEDKVWGLLGIKTCDSDPEGETFVKPELGLKPWELYERVARKVIVRGDLRCLAAVEHGEYEEGDYKMEGRASWVPNFARNRATFLPALNVRAHGDTQTRIINSRCPRPLCLTVEGIEADIITSIIRLDIPRESHWRGFERLQNLQSTVRELLRSESETAIALCLTTGFTTDMKAKVTDTSAHNWALRAFHLWREPVNIKHGAILPPSESATEKIKTAYKYFQASASAMHRRCLFKTKGGLLAAGPQNARVGDIVAVLFGGSVPFVLRPNTDHYQLIGQSYVNGLMEGQAIQAWQKSRGPTKNIHII